jgi:membrane protease YdiL (CAAX protease family)
MTFTHRQPSSTVRRTISLAAVAGFPAVLMIWYRMHQVSTLASIELIAYPLLFGGLGIIVILLLKRLYLREPLSDFNSGSGNLFTDVLWGLALAIACFALFFISQMTLRDLLDFRPNAELLGLMLDMRAHPWMVLVWFGPVLWIGIALYEELVRAFLLTELWSFAESKVWIGLSIVLAGTLFGLVHWGQGPYGIVTIAIKSMVIGAFYLRIRRILPLVLAHVLYDGVQVGTFLLTYPGG